MKRVPFSAMKVERGWRRQKVVARLLQQKISSLHLACAADRNVVTSHFALGGGLTRLLRTTTNSGQKQTAKVGHTAMRHLYNKQV